MDRATWQIVQLAAALGLGLSLGILYDFYRVWFRRGRAKFAMVIGDSIFTLFALIWTFVALVWLNWGELRFYILFAIFIGVLIYLKLFSPYLLPFWQKLFCVIGSLIMAILKILGQILLTILKPIVFISSLLYRLIYYIMRILGLTGKNLNKGLYKFNKNAKRGGKYFKNKIKIYAGKLKKRKNN